MVGISGDRAGQLGENGEYLMGRLRVVWIINSELQGGSPHLCWLRPASVVSEWTSIWNVITHTGHMDSPNWVASCVDKLDDTLPRFTGVQRDSVRATQGVSAEAYVWKTSLGQGRSRPGFFIASWTIATHGALQAYVCCVVRFIPLQGWLLIWISTTPSNMGGGLFTESKYKILNFIIMWWQLYGLWLPCSHGLC
jgi:hypothetical protein